jgi:hypothetical protein
MDSKALYDKYEMSMKAVRECKVNDNSAEKNQGKAYQNLVKAGLVMQIKKKYRSW